MTEYFEYHPGGEEELLRGIGIDATDLFDQVSSRINAERMPQFKLHHSKITSIMILCILWKSSQKTILMYLFLKISSEKCVWTQIDQAVVLCNQVHKWVNYDSMLKKCLVGRLKTEISVPVKAPSRLVSNGGSFLSPPPPPPPKLQPEVTSDWMQTSASVTIIFYTRQKVIFNKHSLMKCCVWLL